MVYYFLFNSYSNSSASGILISKTSVKNTFFFYSVLIQRQGHSSKWKKSVLPFYRQYSDVLTHIKSMNHSLKFIRLIYAAFPVI